MKLIEDVLSVGGGREQPAEVVLIDAPREEGNDAKNSWATELSA